MEKTPNIEGFIFMENGLQYYLFQCFDTTDYVWIEKQGHLLMILVYPGIFETYNIESIYFVFAHSSIFFWFSILS